MTQPHKSTKAHFLVASSDLSDSNFARTVVLMIDHSEDGAMGIVLNRPLDRSIASIWEEIQEGNTTCQAPVHWGGPVTGPLMALHRVKALADLEILPGVYFSTNKHHIDAVMHSNSPDLRFYIGCAGWSAGQLETEIEEGAWQVVPATTPLVFDGSPDMWDRVGSTPSLESIYTELGVKQLPDNPGMN